MFRRMLSRPGWFMTILALLLSVLFVQETESTHFSYGVIRWEYPPDYFINNQILIHFEATYRWNFSNNFKAVKQNLFNSVEAGSFSFSPSSAGSGLNVSSMNFNVTELFTTSALNWFGGRAVHRHTVKQDLFTINYSLCCRISSLLDYNNDANTRMQAKINLRPQVVAGKTLYFSASPVVRSVPRIYLALGQSYAFDIKGFAISKLPTKFIVPTADAAGLSWSIPCGNRTYNIQYCPNTATALSITTAGAITWRTGYKGTYAFQLWMAEYFPGINFTDNDPPSYSVIDLLFEVRDLTCTTNEKCKTKTNPANNLPYFSAIANSYSFKTGLTTLYTIIVTDEDVNNTIVFTATYLPDGATITALPQAGAERKYTLTWNPNVDQLDSIACFFAYDDKFDHAIGNKCAYMNVVVLPYIFINGIVRDFKADHVDFDVSASYGSSMTQWVKPDLVDNKPARNTATGTQMPQKFDEWFNDVATVNMSLINTITLTDKGTYNRSKKVYSLFSDEFFPIDGKLYNKDIMGRNFFFTYELHTYFTYLAGVQDTYNFKSNGDMWIFVENKLAQPNNNPQNMHGQGARSYSLDMNAIKLNYSPALEKDKSYKIDIFFAQRSKDLTPTFHIELAESTKCDALSIINASTPPTINHLMTTDTNLRLNGIAALATTGTGMAIAGTTPSESGSVWFLTKQKVMSGFRSTFTFRSNPGAVTTEGLVFMMQNHDASARGSSGSNIGYSSLRNSVAIEFDFIQSAVRSDPSHQHVTIHTAYDGANSSTEAAAYYPAGSTVSINDPNLPLRFTNGTDHRITIEMSPASDVTWLTVFINDNIRPVFESQLDTRKLRDMFHDGAYVGFTSATNEAATSATYVNVSNWKMYVVPPVAAQTIYQTYSPTIRAGERFTVIVQLRDFCGNDIYLDGVADRFSSTVINPYLPTILPVLTKTDIGNGQYSFSFTPTITGTWTISIFFQENPGGTPLLIDKSTARTVVVTPATISPEKSFHYHSYIGSEVVKTPNHDQHGYYCSIIRGDGRIHHHIPGSRYYHFNASTTDAYINKFLDEWASGTSAACARSGIFAYPNTTAGNKLKSIFNRQATPGFPIDVAAPGASVAVVYHRRNDAFMTHNDQNAMDRVRAKTFHFVPQALSTYDFDVLLSSASEQHGSFFLIQPLPTNFRTKVDIVSTMTVVGIDIYGNPMEAIDRPVDFLITPAGPVNDLTTCEAGGVPYFYSCSWSAELTGIYTSTVTAGGSSIFVDRAIYVLSGPASHITSIANSVFQTIVAGTGDGVFQLALRDAGNQAIIVHNPDDIIKVSLVLPGRPEATYVMDSSMWDETLRVRTVRQVTLSDVEIAGVYDLVIEINGSRHSGTSNAKVTVVPNSAAASKSLVYGNVYNNLSLPVPLSLVAGIVNRIYVQTYDRYSNIKSTRDADALLQLTITTAGKPDEVKQAVYENEGRFYFDFFVTSTNKHAFAVNYKVQFVPVRISPTVITTTGKYEVTDISPGPLSDKSYFFTTLNAGVPVRLTNDKLSFAAGQKSTVSLYMLDQYLNPRKGLNDVAANVIVKFTAVSYEGRLLTGTTTWKACVDAKCELELSGNSSPSLAPFDTYFYKLSVVLRSTGATLLSFGADPVAEYLAVDITPLALDRTKSEARGIVASQTASTQFSYVVVLRDQYNNRLRTCSHTVGTLIKQGATTLEPVAGDECTCDVADPGSYSCTLSNPNVIGTYTYHVQADAQDISAVSVEILENSGQFFCHVENPEETRSPRLGATPFTFRVIPTHSTFDATSPATAASLTVKLVLSSNPDSTNFVYLAGVDEHAGTANEGTSFKFTYDVTAVSDYIIIPSRSGLLETNINTGNSAHRTGSFHPGAFSPRNSPITYDSPLHTIVAGVPFSWSVVPYDASGNRFKVCQPETASLDVRVVDADTTVPPAPIGDAFQTCACSVTDNIPSIKCNIKFNETSKYEVYLVGGSTTPKTLPNHEDNYVTSSFSLITVNNAPPSPLTSKIVADSADTPVESFSFADANNIRVIRYGESYFVYVRLFDEFGNAAVVDDYSSLLTIHFSQTSPLNVGTFIRDGLTNAYRCSIVLKHSYPSLTAPLIITFKLNNVLVNTTIDVAGGFKTLVTSSHPASAVFAMKSLPPYQVDTDIAMHITIKDSENNVWAQELAVPEVDASKIIVSFTSAQLSSAAATVSLLPTHVPGTYKLDMSAVQFTLSGDYKVRVEIDTIVLTTDKYSGLNDQVTSTPVGYFHLKTGPPSLINSEIISRPTGNLISGQEYSVQFYLLDHKYNYVDSTTALPLVLQTINDNMPCAMGSDFSKNTWFNYPAARGVSAVLESQYNTEKNSMLYTIRLGVTFAGKVTVGVLGTDIGKFYLRAPEALPNPNDPHESPDVIKNSSGTQFVSSCSLNAKFFFTIIPGPASAAHSVVSFVSPVTLSNPTLVTGTQVTMDVQLRDVFNQNIVTSNYRVRFSHSDPAENKSSGILFDAKCDYTDITCFSPAWNLRIDETFASQGRFSVSYTLGSIHPNAHPYDIYVNMLTYPTSIITPENIDSYTSASRIAGNNSNTMTVVITPSTPFMLAPLESNAAKFVAGQQGTLGFYALDLFRNQVVVSPSDFSSGKFLVSVEISRDSSNIDFTAHGIPPITVGFYRFYADMKLTSSGTFEGLFTPFWEGRYNVIFSLYVDRAPSPVFTGNTSFVVDHGNCLIRDANKPFLCSSGVCAENAAACVPAATCAGKITCSDGSCVDSVKDCPCPIATPLCATTKSCMKAELCPVAPITCPSGTTACPNSPTQCRAKESDCPSPVACPPTYVFCSNGFTCAPTEASCPATPATACPNSGVMCPNGTCAVDLASCPTPVSCPAGKVLCLTDRSCATDAANCPSQIECPSGQVRCSSNTCASSSSNCPTDITCPVGFVRCENGSCAHNATSCLAPFICNITEIKCPDGTCAQNLGLCPSIPTCPPSKPIMCSDRACVTSVAECAAISSCPTGSQVCPDGTCVLGTPCPVVKTCPVTAPVLCADRSCTTSSDLCHSPLTCTIAHPVRCPTGVCRANIVDCPSQIPCSPSRPYRCADGTCAQAPNVCADATTSINTGVPSNGSVTPVTSTCPSNKITCPGGECAASALLCPTHVTCPLGSVKCNDGRCAAVGQCPSSADYTDCENQIVCPIATAGVSCAKNLEDCPVGIVCPAEAPVKCIDSSCAVSMSLCPPLPPSGGTTRSPCPDGSWSVSTCPTPVTCPDRTPYKCYDQSCRISPFDCPAAPVCPATSPFLCSSGRCVVLPWDCATPVDGTCPYEKPIKCPVFNGEAKCAANISQCPSVYDDDPTGDRMYCLSGAVRCHDGTCKERAADCTAPKCPEAFSYLCPDGMCAKNVGECNVANGCPFNKPVKCDSGSCTDRYANCQIMKCADGSTPCSDGSCRHCTDVTASGCSVGQVRCYDGSCVESYNKCTARTDSMNVCPGNRPFKCANGLCVTTAASCPILDPSGTVCTDPSKPIFCADGSCQSTGELCRVIKPCDKTGTVRCADGVCRAKNDASSDACPLAGTCPPSLPFRCPEGPCALNSGSCFDSNGCPKSNNISQIRCSTGLCVTSQALCDNTPLENGCATASPFKCWDGSCATSASTCPVSNGCPSTSPIRCGSGECVSTVADCAGKDTCPETKFKCPDGGCAETEDACQTPFGCPVTKPVRCANGSCAKYPATFRSSRFQMTPQQLADTCAPTVICPSNDYVRCANGSCVFSVSQCPSLNNPCTSPDKKNLCPDLVSCVDSLASCPSTSSVCPPTSAFLCADGSCVGAPNECNTRADPRISTITGSVAAVKCPSNKITCFDGSCADTYSKCIEHAKKIDVASSSNCPLRCSDGTCLPVNDPSLCPSIRACRVGEFRCSDGSCTTSKATCDAMDFKCSSEHQERGIDGICRLTGTNPSFDGCSWNPNANYYCANRECASEDKNCASAANLKADAWARLISADNIAYRAAVKAAKDSAQPIVTQSVSSRYLSNLHSKRMPMSVQNVVSVSDDSTNQPIVSDIAIEEYDVAAAGLYPLACVSNCPVDTKVSESFITYKSSSTSKQSLSASNTIISVTVPSGIVINPSKGGSNIHFAPVAASQVYNATNRVHYSRVAGSEDYPSTLTFAQTVISPMVSCFSEAGIQQPFAARIELTASIYRHDSLKYGDICLARLRRFPDSAYDTWDCVYDNSLRATGRVSVKPNPAVLPNLVTSSFEYCNDPDVPGEYAIYAFIVNPMASRQVYTQSLDTWFRDNMIWALLILCGVLCLIALGLYIIQRFSRFKGKTVQIKDDVDRMELEVDEMEQFGGKAGTKDEEIATQHNPLAVQLADMEKLTDENHLRLQQEKIAQQQAESAERTQLIGQLEEESKRNIAALEAMKQKLAHSGQPQRVNDGSGAAVLTMAPVASPSGGAAPGPAAPVAPMASAPPPTRQPVASAPPPMQKKNHDM